MDLSKLKAGQSGVIGTVEGEFALRLRLPWNGPCG